MEKEFLLEIVTPEEERYHEPVEELICQTAEGQLGILKNHSPMLAALTGDSVRVKTASGWQDLPVQGGLLKTDGKQVLIFTD
ncbi:MAG: hypothetical protein IJT66_02045 [Clostridia bacterium]|nr:hypothetical protein [Clostridia bacterium]